MLVRRRAGTAIRSNVAVRRKSRPPSFLFFPLPLLGFVKKHSTQLGFLFEIPMACVGVTPDLVEHTCPTHYCVLVEVISTCFTLLSQFNISIIFKAQLSDTVCK